MSKFQKVVLVLVDGMRPDSLAACGNPFVAELLAHSAYTLKGTTVMPSVTLPCHFSLFHSVAPQRHGILTNIYVPQVRPVRGLFEALHGAGKSSAMFYDWEELRDLSRPDNITYACFASGHQFGYEKANPIIVANLLHYFKTYGQPDFTFLYLGWTDEAGHDFGWMTPEYLRAVGGSLDSVRQVVETLGDDTLVILTADHGGHERSHGTEMPEDMTIPVFLYNRTFAGHELSSASILDLAPTAADVLCVPADREWEGKSLL